MTNGGKLKEVFPNAEIDYGLRGVVAVTFIHKTIFDLDWWNAEYKEPTTKNNLGVDAVSRQAVLELIADYDLSMGQVVRGIHALPPVIPQEPKPMVEIDLDYVIKQKYIEREVLDKIQSEIRDFMYDINPSSSESDYACNYILQMIDKYKAESEEV